MLAATVALLLALTLGGTTYRVVLAADLGLLAVSLVGWVLFVWRLRHAPRSRSSR